MNRQQVAEARALAMDFNQSLMDVDDSILAGLCLPDFKPVVCTIRVAARLFRDFIYIGQAKGQPAQWDNEAINEVIRAARHRIQIA